MSVISSENQNTINNEIHDEIINEYITFQVPNEKSPILENTETYTTKKCLNSLFQWAIVMSCFIIAILISIGILIGCYYIYNHFN